MKKLGVYWKNDSIEDAEFAESQASDAHGVKGNSFISRSDPSTDGASSLGAAAVNIRPYRIQACWKQKSQLSSSETISNGAKNGRVLFFELLLYSIMEVDKRGQRGYVVDFRNLGFAVDEGNSNMTFDGNGNAGPGEPSSMAFLEIASL
jgi:hypothetical protein